MAVRGLRTSPPLEVVREVFHFPFPMEGASSRRDSRLGRRLMDRFEQELQVLVDSICEQTHELVFLGGDGLYSANTRSDGD